MVHNPKVKPTQEGGSEDVLVVHSACQGKRVGVDHNSEMNLVVKAHNPTVRGAKIGADTQASEGLEETPVRTPKVQDTNSERTGKVDYTR